MNREYFENYKPRFSDGILRDHNIRVYEKIINGLSKRNKVLFEQATGTGKTYLALKFLHDHAKGKKVLFVSPSDSIDMYFIDTLVCTLLDLDEDKILGISKKQKIELIKEFLDIDFSSCLYQGLKGVQDKIYDIIIFDEAHRMGAKTWGPNAAKLINNNPDANIIGMTATMDRTDGEDIKKYFDGKSPVSRITLVDALKKGILPSFDYKLGKISFEEERKFVEDSIKDFNEKLKTAEGEERKEILEFLEKLKHAKKVVSGSKEIPSIFKESIDTEKLKKGKYIVFCPPGQDFDEDNESIHRMQAIMEQAPSWFAQVGGVKGVKTYSVYSQEGATKNRQTIKEFERDDSDSLKLLFSINMLNEGLHVDDIDGVIMLRSTSSRIIYLQQLGRALSVGHNQKPKIFDFVANLSYVDVQEITGIAKSVNRSSETEVDVAGFDGEVDIREKEIFNLEIENLEELQFIEKLKSNIYAFNHKNDFDFEDFCRRLKEYKDEFGDCRVPQSYQCKDKYPLGKKIVYLRTQETKMSIERKAKLNELGFVWDATIRFDFEGFYERLLEYKKKFGDCKVSKSYKCADGYSLGAKVRSIRKGDISLNAQQKERLNKLNFIWRVDRINEGNIRNAIIIFASQYLDFVKTEKRKPVDRSGKLERNLYQKWRLYSKAENLSEEEIKFLESKGIEVRYQKLETDNIRQEVKKFVTDYIEFLKIEKRAPHSNKKGEWGLYNRWKKYTNPQNLTPEEMEFIVSRGIELSEDQEPIREAIKKFVKDYNDFVSSTGRKPSDSRKNRGNGDNNESRLYQRWCFYSKRENLNSDEVAYLERNGISVREKIDIQDNIRIAVRQFVEEYKLFLQENGRQPRAVLSKKEESLYNKWLKYTKSKNLTSEEVDFLQENNIKLTDSEGETEIG